MARRLSKKDSPKKSLPSSNQVNSFQNFNCSSSTCSTMSPHSPSGRTLFRTPSYKMPKTPSLSRQHPSTYVTQHTSSRSRSSSRVSSRAASPTREHIEALLQSIFQVWPNLFRVCFLYRLLPRCRCISEKFLFTNNRFLAVVNTRKRSVKVQDVIRQACMVTVQ